MWSTMILLDLLTVSSACANYSVVETSAVGLRLHQKVRERGQVLLKEIKDACAHRRQSHNTQKIAGRRLAIPSALPYFPFAFRILS